MSEQQYDEVDLKVKELLGINPYPNLCKNCGEGKGYAYQLSQYVINALDGFAYCETCKKRLPLGRLNGKSVKVRTTFKMVEWRRKNEKKYKYYI